MRQNTEKLFSQGITLIGAIFIIYGTILCTMSNLNSGVILVLVFGIVLFSIGFFYKKINNFKEKKIIKVCKSLFLVLMCAEIGLLSCLVFYGVSDNVTYREDAVIVLGAGVKGDKVSMPLKMRLDKAIEYHKKNPHALIIVTGGKGFQETVTEAFAMEKYLLQNGVDSNKIVKEEKATSTMENMKFSKEILDKRFRKDYSVVVITNNFHILRGVAMAKKNGFLKVTHMHAGLQWYNLMPCYLRESLAVLKMYILG